MVPGQKKSRQQWMTRANARAFVTSLVRQGLFGQQRWSYWKFLLRAATRYRRCFGAAMTLVVMGYHFQMLTRTFSAAVEVPAPPPAMDMEQLP